MIMVENAHPQLGLRGEERLHAAERGVRLLPHQLAPHQSLQLHDASQRAQSRPRLRLTHRQRSCHVLYQGMRVNVLVTTTMRTR